MTVTYTADVATCKKFGCFFKLLIKWRGSVYKIIWMDLLVFLILYYILSFTYRFLMDDSQKHGFENLVIYCRNYASIIPLSFVLGFYVAVVMQRWWEQYITIPWPDPLAVFVSSFLHGQDERGRVMRRTVMRYACLCLTIALTMISPRVKKRFPTLDHLVDAGLMLENEKLIFEKMDKSFPKHPKHWMPIIWAASIITRARKEGRIRDDFAVKTIIDELNIFRGKCGVLMCYDLISIPLVYTQVVTLAVYSYFLCSVVGHQWINEEIANGYQNIIDCYFPIFTTLHFFFYMGWLKVAETLINPFGEDDDDFEVNWMIDRNLQVSYLIVDEMHQMHPQLVKDQYWDEVFPNELPYATDHESRPQPLHSTTDITSVGGLPVIEKTKNALLPNYKAEDRSANASNRNLPNADNPSYFSRIGNLMRSFISGDKNPPKKSESTSSIEDDIKHPINVITFDSLHSNLADDEQENNTRTWPSPQRAPEVQAAETDADEKKISQTTAAPEKIDEFENLRKQRLQERADRAHQNYLRRLEKLQKDIETEATDDGDTDVQRSSTNPKAENKVKDKGKETDTKEATLDKKDKIALQESPTNQKKVPENEKLRKEPKKLPKNQQETDEVMDTSDFDNQPGTSKQPQKKKERSPEMKRKQREKKKDSNISDLDTESDTSSKPPQKKESSKEKPRKQKDTKISELKTESNTSSEQQQKKENSKERRRKQQERRESTDTSDSDFQTRMSRKDKGKPKEKSRKTDNMTTSNFNTQSDDINNERQGERELKELLKKEQHMTSDTDVTDLSTDPDNSTKRRQDKSKEMPRQQKEKKKDTTISDQYTEPDTGKKRLLDIMKPKETPRKKREATDSTDSSDTESSMTKKRQQKKSEEK